MDTQEFTGNPYGIPIARFATLEDRLHSVGAVYELIIEDSSDSLDLEFAQVSENIQAKMLGAKPLSLTTRDFIHRRLLISLPTKRDSIYQSWREKVWIAGPSTSHNPNNVFIQTLTQQGQCLYLLAVAIASLHEVYNSVPNLDVYTPISNGNINGWIETKGCEGYPYDDYFDIKYGYDKAIISALISIWGKSVAGTVVDEINVGTVTEVPS